MKSTSTALITGANKGIGLETARQLGRKGMHVLLGSRDRARGSAAADGLRAEGLSVDLVELDVTSAASIHAAAASVSRTCERLDVLVNNAAVSLDDQTRQPSEQSIDMWRRTFENNFFGMIAVTQAFLPLLRRSEAGRIVNLSSGLASITHLADPNDGMPKHIAAYSISKTAVNTWTVLLAHELRNTPIKVNAADPGWVKTDLGGPDAMLELEEGAQTSVWLATLDETGPTGGFFHKKMPRKW
jgi:NAD(P)-dependent dehydrogenase (short-subunit alcohol dehydrogenase family)